MQTLESVFSQSFADYEVVVVNDGSPDDTADVLRPLAELGKIKYIEQPNAGQAAARNRGLAEAVGEFIAFLDDDDMWPEDKLKWQVAFLEAGPDAGMVYGAVRMVGDGEDYVSPGTRKVEDPDFESMFECNPIVSPGQTLIRASVLRAVGGFDPALWGVDDHDLYIRISRVAKIKFVNRLSLVYRLHGANASRDTLRMFANSRLLLPKHIESVPELRRRTIRKRYKAFLYRGYARHLIYVGLSNLRGGSIRRAMQCFWWAAGLHIDGVKILAPEKVMRLLKTN